MVKAWLVGRHAAGEIPGVNVEKTVDMTWSASSAEAGSEFLALAEEAFEQGCALLLQAVPGSLAMALAEIGYWCGQGGSPMPKFGIIVSKPGPRPADQVRTFETSIGDEAQRLADAIAFANPNAKINVLDDGKHIAIVGVTLDPPKRFEYDHTEWSFDIDMWTCEFCGSLRKITFESVPYAAEVHGDQTMRRVCAECRAESAANIP